MILRTFQIGSVIMVAMLCAIAGCTKRSGQQSVYAVSGKLTYRGQPMSGAQIVFRLVADPNPRVLGILAHADANGEYKVTSRKRFDGLAVGQYIVTIQWPEAPSGKSGTQGAESEDEAPSDRLRGAYSDPTKSPLRATVAPQTNQIDFALP